MPGMDAIFDRAASHALDKRSKSILPSLGIIARITASASNTMLEGKMISTGITAQFQ